MSVEEFLGGVRVLQTSAENLRAPPPPLDVFDTFPIQAMNKQSHAQVVKKS